RRTGRRSARPGWPGPVRRPPWSRWVPHWSPDPSCRYRCAPYLFPFFSTRHLLDRLTTAVCAIPTRYHNIPVTTWSATTWEHAGVVVALLGSPNADDDFACRT